MTAHAINILNNVLRFSAKVFPLGRSGSVAAAAYDLTAYVQNHARHT